ncbi:MAG: imidazoleglycerol-phosphate dehydratase HisB [Ardenticatenia bacterium]|nr:imidazoleglycerol-phosphate dehydratase HisB [Ardenticatenia bacterium]
MGRKATIHRETSETQIEIALDLDGRGQAQVSTGIGFLDHMLTALARHARFDIEVRARGDLDVDEHHTVEDVGIVLGRALSDALGDRAGITRMGHAVVPMDEALALVAIDIGGRGVLVCLGRFDTQRVGGRGTSLVSPFFPALAAEARMNLHAHLLAGSDDHHRAEALFKALARALHHATRPDPTLGGEVPSTKHSIEV